MEIQTALFVVALIALVVQINVAIVGFVVQFIVAQKK